MTKCNPIEMRKNLSIVEDFRNANLDFVAIPVRDNEHKKELIRLCNEILDEMTKEAEHAEIKRKKAKNKNNKKR